MSVDTGLVVSALQRRGHTVGHVIPVPENAGEYEFEVDGSLLTLNEARALMEAEDASTETVAREQEVVLVDTVEVVPVQVVAVSETATGEVVETVETVPVVVETVEAVPVSTVK